MLDVYHDPNDMEKINRQKLFDDFDNILERVEKENKGFIITDEGKADLVLCPANWFNIEADTDFSTIVGCALRYALGRYTYMPSTVKGFIERHIEAITENDLNVMINDIEDKMKYNKELPYKELWLELRDDLVVELKKREESQSKGKGNNGNNNN